MGWFEIALCFAKTLKMTIGKLNSVWILVCIALVFFTASKTHAIEKKIENYEQIELIIARDVTLDRQVWCGNKILLVALKNGKTMEIDTLNNKSRVISHPHNVTLEACTSDNEWMIYSNRQSVRWDKGSYERGVVDFWRYNLKTGKRQKFAIAEDGSDIEISPDGKKFLFDSSQPKTYIRQPEPKWELIWPSGKWGPKGTLGGIVEAHWLSDSSKILILARDKKDKKYKFFVEETGKNKISQLSTNLENMYINGLRIDRANRIYILASPVSSFSRLPKASDLKYSLFRCSIKGETLDCEEILKRDKSIESFDITPDGKKIVFKEEIEAPWRKNTCIWLFEEGASEVKCITPNATDNSVFSISPDGRWVAYTRSRVIKQTRIGDIVTNDLYLIKIDK